MARPQKRTVDYFPHFTNASTGDTLTILENQFGNDGYAFWFKLLEKISSSENHIIDCRNSKKWQLLLAKTRVDDKRGTAIMDLLCELDAIDAELWQKDKLIWCQNLVNNISDVYNNRRSPIPQKPISMNHNGITTGNNAISTPDNLATSPSDDIPTPDNAQSKVEYSKVKNSIVIPDFINKELWDDFLDMRKKIKRPATAKAQELLIKDLEKLKADGDDPNTVLEQSIKRSWQGLFTTKERDGAHKANPRAVPTKYTRPEEL